MLEGGTRIPVAVAALSLALFTATTEAALTTFSTRGSFDAAAGTTTLIDFEEPLNQPGCCTYYATTYTSADVTFTESGSRLFVISPNHYNTNTSQYLNNNTGSNTVGISFATSSVFAVGMDIGWLTTWGAPPYGTMIFNVTDINGGIESFSSAVPGPLANSTTPMGFVGFTSDVAIASVSILDNSLSHMIDNFAYGGIAPIPEPETYALLLAGLAFLGFETRRRRKLQHAV